MMDVRTINKCGSCGSSDLSHVNEETGTRSVLKDMRYCNNCHNETVLAQIPWYFMSRAERESLGLKEKEKGGW